MELALLELASTDAVVRELLAHADADLTGVTRAQEVRWLAEIDGTVDVQIGDGRLRIRISQLLEEA